jgi:hypothetical protein
MNYELAKELKDAGFPQKGNGGFLVETELVGETIAGKKDTECYTPTLSELIEACMPRKLHLVVTSEKSMAWVGDGTRNSGGSTLEEAVARLWLALNKKA